ncbi:MAG: putative lipopolysaccharide heptosyltransferase III [Desulfurivibrionaceae bacterium]|jgi:heptosyltransferase-3
MTSISGKQTIQGSPRSILLIQLGDIGDVVLSTPCIRALRDRYPQARIVVVVWDKAAELLEDCPWLDHVVAVTKQPRSLWGEVCFQVDFFRKLRNFHFDLAIDLRTGTRGAILAFFSGARQRIGFYAVDGKLWRNRIFTSLLYREYVPDQHVVDYLLSLLEAFGVTTEEHSPALVVSGDKLEKIEDFLKAEKIEPGSMLVAVQPFSLWRYKEWGQEKYISLISWLMEKQSATVLVTGSAPERQRAEEIVRNCDKRCYNLAGKTSIAMYAALLKKCHLFIGVDSAGLHIAAAVGTPTVSIFGPSSPMSWAPRGARHLVVQKEFDCLPCRQKGCRGSEKSRCLDELAVDEVVQKIEKVVSKN